MKPKNGLVNFLRKQEGKPPVSKNFKRIPFPEVEDLERFERLCYHVFHYYLPGEHLTDSSLREDVDYGFTWDTGPIDWTLWKEMNESGYIHPECYECLYAWHKMMLNGEVVQQYEDEDVDIMF